MKKICLLIFFISLCTAHHSNAQNRDSVSSGGRRSVLTKNNAGSNEIDRLRENAASRKSGVNNDSAIRRRVAQVLGPNLIIMPPDSSLLSSKKTKQKIYPSNIIKINMLGLVLKNFSLQYERVFTKAFSAAVGLRFMPNGSIPQISTMENIGLIQGEEFLNTIKQARVKGLAVTPEIRFYTGEKGYGRGFYIAPFYRYAVMQAENLLVNVGDANQTRTINLSAKLKTNTFGLQIGAQWMLTERLSLDWWIMGPQFGRHTINFDGSLNTDFTAAEATDIQNFFRDNEFAKSNMVADVKNNNVTASSGGSWAFSFLSDRDLSRSNRRTLAAMTGLRVGLSLGIRL